MQFILLRAWKVLEIRGWIRAPHNPGGGGSGTNVIEKIPNVLNYPQGSPNHSTNLESIKVLYSCSEIMICCLTTVKLCFLFCASKVNLIESCLRPRAQNLCCISYTPDHTIILCHAVIQWMSLWINNDIWDATLLRKIICVMQLILGMGKLFTGPIS